MKLGGLNLEITYCKLKNVHKFGNLGDSDQIICPIRPGINPYGI